MANLKAQRVSFSTDFSSLRETKIIFLAVGTPAGEGGRADLSSLHTSLESVVSEMGEDAVVVVKSTVPVGSADTLREMIRGQTDKPFSIVSNPEFLREGTAVEDFMRPDRVVIGLRREDKGAKALMAELYAPSCARETPVLYE